MKKFLLMGLLALGLLTVTGQSAHAWVNAKFSAGINCQWQSGGNCLLWGLFKNDNVPGPGMAGPFQVQPPPAGAFPGFATPEFQYFGQAGGNTGQATAQASPPAGVAPQQQRGTPPTVNGQQSTYQPANYSPTPYAYPPPAYWYGR